MMKFSTLEKLFLFTPYSNKIKADFSLKIRLLAVVIVLFSLLDHYVYFASAAEKVENQMKDCDEDKRDFWKIFYTNERQVLFQILPYYAWEIPLLELYEVIKTMCWTYSEVRKCCSNTLGGHNTNHPFQVFVIAVAITLAARFEQLTNRLKTHRGRHMSDSFWHEIRCHYNTLADLVLQADKVLSPFIAVYSFSNMFFLCQKIFTQFEKGKLPWELIYSYYSSTLLISRTVGMLYFCASVNEKSRLTLPILREVPNQNFNGVDVNILQEPSLTPR